MPLGSTGAERAAKIPDVLLDESYRAWACACACETWVGYLARLVQAAGPLAVFEANAQLLDDSLTLGDRVAMARLLGAGLSAPLLNDA